MVTINPATILGWHNKLGSIDAGKWADLVLVAGKTGDVYQQLIRVRETSLTLVMVDGVPRVGRASLMNRFDPGAPDTIRVGASTRVLNVADPAGDPIVGDLKLSDATVTLRQAMQNLPQLAAALDTAIASGAGFGATAEAGVGDATGAVPAGTGW